MAVRSFWLFRIFWKVYKLNFSLFFSFSWIPSKYWSKMPKRNEANLPACRHLSAPLPSAIWSKRRSVRKEWTKFCYRVVLEPLEKACKWRMTELPFWNPLASIMRPRKFSLVSFLVSLGGVEFLLWLSGHFFSIRYVSLILLPWGASVIVCTKSIGDPSLGLEGT